MAEADSTRDDQIRAALQVELDHGARRAAAAGPEVEELWALTSQSMLGGKLVRPRLLLDMVAALATDPASSPSPSDEILRAAAGLEILHGAFLLHDDVIDEDTTRRGCDNVIGHLVRQGGLPATGDGPAVSSPRSVLHFARSAAILAGDLLLTTAHLLLARLGLAPARRLALLDLVEDATLDTVAGEVMDVAFADGIRAAEVEAVLDMTARKTAAYTVELPWRMAAVLAGRPDLDEPLRRAGRHVGLAYQLQDDLLSAFGDPADHGKDPLSDLREGKQTALIVLARGTDAWDRIRRDLGRPDLDAPAADALRAHLAECGARAEVERIIAREHRMAREVLGGCEGMPPAVLGTVDALLERLERRVR